jgi:hypothetical protein
MTTNQKINKQIHLQTPYDGSIETGTYIDLEVDDQGQIIRASLRLEDALRLVKVIEAETRELID